jgi:hypothetical protein
MPPGSSGRKQGGSVAIRWDSRENRGTRWFRGFGRHAAEVREDSEGGGPRRTRTYDLLIKSLTYSTVFHGLFLRPTLPASSCCRLRARSVCLISMGVTRAFAAAASLERRSRSRDL